MLFDGSMSGGKKMEVYLRGYLLRYGIKVCQGSKWIFEAKKTFSHSSQSTARVYGRTRFPISSAQTKSTKSINKYCDTIFFAQNVLYYGISIS